MFRLKVRVRGQIVLDDAEQTWGTWMNLACRSVDLVRHVDIAFLQGIHFCDDLLETGIIGVAQTHTRTRLVTRNSRGDNGVDRMDQFPFVLYSVRFAAGRFRIKRDNRQRWHNACNEDNIANYEPANYESLQTLCKFFSVIAKNDRTSTFVDGDGISFGAMLSWTLSGGMNGSELFAPKCVVKCCDVL